MSACLVTPAQLARLLDTDAAPIVFDCRFDLADADAGREGWRSGHVPGAVHADLDTDLAAPVTAESGRHPLPDPVDFATFLARSGWTPGRRVVAYDEQGGAFAVRLWWLMRHFGHDDVCLLDGGFRAWREAGLEVEEGEVTPLGCEPVTLAANDDTLDADAVAGGLGDGSLTLVDARAADRFEGRNETIDPVAGHVPGALNLPFAGNLDSNGRFLDAGALKERFRAALSGAPPAEVAHMCGSGVTACHNLFAMERAGLEGSRLYPGSWSEWIRDPNRPVTSS